MAARRKILLTRAGKVDKRTRIGRVLFYRLDEMELFEEPPKPVVEKYIKPAEETVSSLTGQFEGLSLVEDSQPKDSVFKDSLSKDLTNFELLVEVLV